jgi:hypothetical protein
MKVLMNVLTGMFNARGVRLKAEGAMQNTK